eukprot:COSAG06_NODE_32347_length_507_cov_4.941176_1_plen_76_part_10
MDLHGLLYLDRLIILYLLVRRGGARAGPRCCCLRAYRAKGYQHHADDDDARGLRLSAGRDMRVGSAHVYGRRVSAS